MPGPAPPDLRRLIGSCRAGDPSACALVARRRGCRSVTELVQVVWPEATPTGGLADAVLDGWALCREVRADEARRRRAFA